MGWLILASITSRAKSSNSGNILPMMRALAMQSSLAVVSNGSFFQTRLLFCICEKMTRGEACRSAILSAIVIQDMPTYIYETQESSPIRFEVKQSMRDEALTHHPQTGVPVRRIISGGFGFIQKSAQPTRPPGCDGVGGCGCAGACGH